MCPRTTSTDNWLQETQLTMFGSTSDKGFIHIPIQDAIKLVIPQLPVRKQPAEKPSQDKPAKDQGSAL